MITTLNEIRGRRSRNLLRRTALGAVSIVAIATLVLHAAETESGSADQENGYRFGPQLQVLQRDLTSDEYHAVLETMIPTDLEAEWLRVATPDNYITFREHHGGAEKVSSDKSVQAAYEQRKKIANDFLALMRTAYAKREKEPPFGDTQEIESLLAKAAERKVSEAGGEAVAVRTIMPAPGSERQWPRLRGPTGQGTAIETDFPMNWSRDENVVWETKLPGEGNSSPVIWGDRIFVTSASEDGEERLLLCYSRSDGEKLWQQAAPKPTAQEKMYWKNNYASSTPVTDGERVVVSFGNSGMLCCDFEGNVLWHAGLGEFTMTHGPGTSPVIYNDMVIFIQDQNRGESVFVAFDKHTGEELWQRERESAMCWSTPVLLRVGDRDELVYNGSHYVIGYDPETGEELWRAGGTTREAIPMIVVGGGLLYSTSGRNGPTLAIRPGGNGDVSESHLQWQTVRGGPHVPSPVYYEGRLYMVNDTGIVTCLDAADGSLVWQKRLRGRFSMSPIEAGGRLILTSEDGLSYVLEAGDEFKVLAENDLEEYTVATPAVLDGRIYFRTKSSLICIGERG